MSGLQPFALQVICEPPLALAFGDGFDPLPWLSSVPDPTVGLFASAGGGDAGEGVDGAAVACAAPIGCGPGALSAFGAAAGAAPAGSAERRSAEREHATVESAARNAAWVKVGLAMMSRS